jgi:hypothetical protein
VGFVHQDLPVFKRAFAALRLINSKRRTQQPVESQDASVTNTAMALNRTLHRKIPERAWLSRLPMPVVRTTSSDASGCEAVPPEPSGHNPVETELLSAGQSEINSAESR